MSDVWIIGKGQVNVFEQFQKEQNLRFKLEKLLQANEERPYKEQFFISTTREELEILISKFQPKET